MCFTFTEPSDSRYWFPCWDEPWDKAERGCQINVTVPDTFLACSNGLLDSVTADSSARTKTFWWTEHFPIATYLMTFSASRFSTWKQRWARAPGDTIDVKYYILTMDSTSSESAFANVPDMLSFFNRPDVFGLYPFEKYGMDAFGNTPAAMENQTMTMIAPPRNCDQELMAHELSHQWWGDMVTCFTWANIWLNEGFANYSAALYMEHQQGHAFFMADLDTFANWYFSEDAGHRFPIYNPPPNWIFSSTTYCKGAWVQHMLRYVMSDTSATHGLFFQGLRAYGDSLKYGNASTADYQRILEHTYGDTLNWFFNEWVYLAGYPQYHVNWFGVPESAAWRVKVDISQNNGIGAPPVFHMPVEILFHLAGKDTLVHYPITTSPQHNEFVVSARPDSAVFDPGDWILKKVTMTNVGVETADRKDFLTPFALGGAAPSPFSQETRISYSLARKGKTELVVYDVSGRKVGTLMDREGSPGASWVKWDGRDDLGRQVPSGVYFYRLQAGSFSDTKKMVLLR
jgi:aminopeptidase N